MNCPFCNQPMKEGFLHARKAIVWDPERLNGCLQPYNEGSFYVAYKFGGICIIKSLYCDHCRAIITYCDK